METSVAEGGSGLVRRSVDEARSVVADAVARSRRLVLALDRVRAAGGRPIVVGGAVRDAFLGYTPKDFDIECHNIGRDELVELLRATSSLIEVGSSFAVLKLRIERGVDVDFSLPRRDRKTGVGHREFEVEVHPDLGIEAAASRRDFTLNAMAFDLATGELLDPFGGLRDLADGVLRHTSDAFAEDPLRVLRGAQFAARFGLTMHPDTVAACASIVGEYAHLSIERVWTEFEKIFRLGVVPSRAFRVLVDTTWITHFPELQAIIGVPQDPSWHPEGTVDIHAGLAADAAVAVAERYGLDEADRTFVVCAALLHDLGKATHTQIRADGRITAHGHAEAGVGPARSFLARIGAPADLAARVAPVVKEHMCCIANSTPTPAAVRRLARRLVPASVLDWSYLVEADNRGRAEGSREGCAGPWLATARAEGVEHEPVQPLLRGHHLIAAGLSPGPTFRPILDEALALQEAGAIADEPGAVAWLRHRLAPVNDGASPADPSR